MFDTGKLFKEKEKLEEQKKKKLQKKDTSEKIVFKKEKEKALNLEKSEKELFELKEILNNSKIDYKTREIILKTVNNELINLHEIEEIFTKIDEIEEIKDIDKYLPKENRISKEEYTKAIYDDIFRIQTLIKIKTALAILSTQINPENGFGINIFKGFLLVLDKNLIKIQENHIDIKNSLESIDLKN